MERKVNLLTCEAAVSICSGQMLIPEAKHPSSRTDFSFILNLTYHFPTPILQNKTLKNIENRQGQLIQFWVLTVLLPEGRWTTLAEEALRLNSWEPNSTNGLLKTHMKQRWKKCTMEFLSTSQMWAHPTNFFFFCRKLSVTLLGSKDLLRLRGCY